MCRDTSWVDLFNILFVTYCEGTIMWMSDVKTSNSAIILQIKNTFVKSVKIQKLYKT